MKKRHYIHLFMLLVVLSSTSYGNGDKDFIIPRSNEDKDFVVPRSNEDKDFIIPRDNEE